MWNLKLDNNASLDSNKYIRIRDAAIALFNKQGIHNTSIQEIANQAGVAKGTIYLYFKNREELVRKVIAYCFDLYKKAFIEGVEFRNSSSDKLKYSIKNTILWANEFPKEASVLSLFHKPVNIVGTKDVVFTEVFNINREIIKVGVERGEFKELPLEFLCTIYFGSVEGITKYAIRNPDILKDEKLLDKMLEAMIDSIRL